MTPDALLIVTLIVVVSGLVVWLKVWPWWRGRIPIGRSLGPVVQGKNKSAGVKLEGNSFTFPLAGKSVHALLDGSLALKGKQTLTLRYRIDADPGVTFHPQEAPSGVATISIMIQRKGDYKFSAIGKHIDDRLYSPEFNRLTPGEYELPVDLTNTAWHDTLGGFSNAAQFADVIDNLAAVHVCFGEEYANRAHGVFASGPSRFTLIGLEVLP